MAWYSLEAPLNWTPRTFHIESKTRVPSAHFITKNWNDMDFKRTFKETYVYNVFMVFVMMMMMMVMMVMVMMTMILKVQIHGSQPINWGHLKRLSTFPD